MPIAAEELEEIVEQCGAFTHAPLDFVLWNFDWGHGELTAYPNGPRRWQREVLTDIGNKLRAGGELGCVIREAVASGHGPGKSALVAWLVLWALATCPNARVIVTAETFDQLRTKTWPELAKWYRLSLCKEMFTLTQTALHSAQADYQRTWRADALPWSKENSQAFAGLHNKGNRILVIFDEASQIADVIWEVTEGALTDEQTEIIWAVFGNPTQATGRFRECWGKFVHRWQRWQVDSSKVEGTNKGEIEQWISDYGADSDFVRVRVKGEFPRQAATQFISSELVERARKAEAQSHLTEPLIMGVDVARFGDDESVIFVRKGRDWRTHGLWKFRGIDTMQLAARIAEKHQQLKTNAIFIDGGGVGGGVVDRCRQMNLPNVFDVQFGASADRQVAGAGDERYANKRSEMWGTMRFAMRDGVAMPDDPELAAELTGPEYSFNIRDEILLEAKKDMKKRGLKSPDVADAIALSYAYPVMPLSMRQATGKANMTINDYDPLEER